ncbi:UNVERIFIED_CONTAM: hypothetical protein HDU68_010139 [Siphonaria sp. JEL0065]|nr:hypothetical protein HDU68_010139 [Siphonaria sp. JEL0065]
MDNALKKADLIKRELEHSLEPAKSRVLQVQLLSLLHAVWRTVELNQFKTLQHNRTANCFHIKAWAKFSPKMRSYSTTQISASQTMHAEKVLNNLHMWRRLVESNEQLISKRHDKPLEGLALMNEQPTHFEIRVAFLDLAMRDNLYRDEQLEAILAQVVETYRMTENFGDLDDAEKVGSAAVWNRVLSRLKTEFWLSRKPDNLDELKSEWDGKKKTKSCGHQGGNDVKFRQKERQVDGDSTDDELGNENKPKNRVRWNEDEYFG